MARANLRTQEDSLRVIQAMVSAGRGDEGDLASARAELATVQASVPQQAAARRLAQYRIAVLAGLRPAELGELDAARPQAPLAARLPIGDVGALLSRRPDVLAAERNMAAANADVGVATAELYPRIDLGGFLGFVALRGADFGNASSRAFSVSPGLSWPALHLPTALARKRAAQARSEGEVARYEQTVLRAVEELETALTGYGENQQRLGSLAQAAAQSGRAAELAQLRYKEGTTPYLTVLDAQRSLLRAQDAVAVAETASYTSLIALYKALGGGWQAPGDAGGEGAQQGRQGRWDRDGRWSAGRRRLTAAALRGTIGTFPEFRRAHVRQPVLPTRLDAASARRPRADGAQDARAAVHRRHRPDHGRDGRGGAPADEPLACRGPGGRGNHSTGAAVPRRSGGSPPPATVAFRTRTPK